MKILAKPKHGKINRRNNFLYRHIENSGVQVVDFDNSFSIFYSYDIFHMHWPDRIMLGNWLTILVKAILLTVLLTFLKLRGCRVVWTVHNPNFKHSKTRFGCRLFVLIIRNLVDGFIFTSNYSKKLITRAFKIDNSRTKNCVIPLGLQTELMPEKTVRLGDVSQIEDYTLVFGRMASDRFGCDSLQAFLDRTDKSLNLVLAGQAIDKEIYAALSAFQKLNEERVILVAREFSDYEVGCLIDYAHSIFIEHRGLNSGVATLAACYNKTIIFSSRKAAELFSRQYDYNNICVIDKNNIKPVTESGLVNSFQSRWDMKKVADETVCFYYSLVRVS